ncbi:Mediator of RNA polymerase II transcription like protein [Argiope bruennichi]|uniref:Mediator of RNA polymerase II transcription subunit 20 n=1 Tax=Argiope bruennichi TaxID=94029 RepID=A0A8T0E401_ARGBR|nr:Mediator of RNA polymerase II transcription like protein [Argiope bruennichi]
MGVVSIHQFPIPEGKSGQQATEILQKRLETIGAIKTGTFCVECELIRGGGPLSYHFSPNRAVNIIHNSEHPATGFALLDTGTCLMADSHFDMLMAKMAGIYIPKKAIKIESKSCPFFGL